MSREILHQVEDDLGIQEAKGLAVDELLAEKTDHAYFDSSADNIKLQKLMKENQHPSNLMTVKPPKLNPEINIVINFKTMSLLSCLMKKFILFPEFCSQNIHNQV